MIPNQSKIGAIVKVLKNIPSSDIMLLCHKNADPDTIGSAFALAQFLRKHISATCKILAESLNKPTEKLVSRLQIDIMKEIDPDARKFIMLDTNNLEQLGTIATTSLHKLLVENPPIIIDHHAPHATGFELTSNYFVLDDVSSSCEIIYQMFKYSETEILPDIAFALLSGIIYDTKHLILASKSTFRAIVDLLDQGVEYQEILATLNVPSSFSERMARVKCAQRMEIERIDDYLLITSYISAYEAAAARTLVYLGADIAIVWAERKDELRLSARCSSNFHAKTGIHLGKLFEKAAGTINGMGGGHRTAAGLNANAQTDPKPIISFIRGVLRKHILEQ
ncbi:MAG: bifunctional oligoribonuclease/PAP phosphatase NrnA [Candidatus Heimdallarchaeota archaeon]